LKKDDDRSTRLRLLEKTEAKLESVRKNVADGKYMKEKVIAKRLYSQQRIDELERLDGCYVITTTVGVSVFNKAEVVDHYLWKRP
jgi:hypothetical protein